MEKLRVWWIPQVPGKPFYVPVNSVEEAKKVLDLLAAYDAFQLENRIKGDYANTGGLEMWNEQENEWYSWEIDTGNNYFDDVDEYCQSCKSVKELQNFSKEIFSQINWEKIDRMTS